MQQLVCYASTGWDWGIRHLRCQVAGENPLVGSGKPPVKLRVWASRMNPSNRNLHPTGSHSGVGVVERFRRAWPAS